MFGAAELTDDFVRLAAEDSREQLGGVLQAMQTQVRVMVVARLSPTPAQLEAADEIAQQVMVALAAGISRLENRTVAGLKDSTTTPW